MDPEQIVIYLGKQIRDADEIVRPGMDLTKIALPTFVLEPRSLLERVTDFFSHPELVFGYVTLSLCSSEISLLDLV